MTGLLGFLLFILMFFGYITMGVVVGSFVEGKWPNNDTDIGILAGIFWPATVVLVVPVLFWARLNKTIVTFTKKRLR